jgi:hypothetical protein
MINPQIRKAIVVLGAGMEERVTVYGNVLFIGLCMGILSILSKVFK